MKVKVNVELILQIPGELQNDFQAVDVIDKALRDMLYVGVHSDELEEGSEYLIIDDLTVRMYKVLAGRIPT
jgi:hypothetical protein